MIARSFVRCTESSSGWCFAIIELALANHDSWRWVQTASVRWNPSFSFAVGINWIGNRTEFELETTFPRTVCQLLVPILWQGYRLLWRHAPKRSSLLNFEKKKPPKLIIQSAPIPACVIFVSQFQVLRVDPFFSCAPCSRSLLEGFRTFRFRGRIHTLTSLFELLWVQR